MIAETKQSLSFKTEREAIPTQTVGKSFKVLIANLEKMATEIVENRKKEGLNMSIQINPIESKKYFDPNYSASWYKDPMTGIRFGIVIGAHPDGNPKFRKIPMGEFLTLNLNHTEDALMWAFLKWHPAIKGTPWETSPRFEVYDPDIEATKIANRANNVRKAIILANSLASIQLPWVCRSLDIEIGTTNNPKVLRSMLLENVMTDPSRYLTFKKSKTFDVTVLLRNAIALGVIREDPEGGLTFKGNHVGVGEQDAIVYLLENTSIMDHVKTELEKKDNNYIAIAERIAKSGDDENDDDDI